MQKGGIKLRRSSKHKNMYAAQASRTARNKARRIKKAMALTQSVEHHAFLTGCLNKPFMKAK